MRLRARFLLMLTISRPCLLASSRAHFGLSSSTPCGPRSRCCQKVCGWDSRLVTDNRGKVAQMLDAEPVSYFCS